MNDSYEIDSDKGQSSHTLVFRNGKIYAYGFILRIKWEWGGRGLK